MTDTYHAVSLSVGKDSTAMLLMMIERGWPIDVVICADTGMEFPEMYEHLEKVDALLYKERGLRIEYLRSDRSFKQLMFEEVRQKGERLQVIGYGWPSMQIRWCTRRLKTHLINKFVNHLKGEKQVIHYVGIAADEPQRIKGERYPLVEWGIDEATALQYCYDCGFDWNGLYEIYHRCSCWCCPLQRIGELRKLRTHHPELWQRLREMDIRAKKQFGPGPLGQFKQGWSVEMLEMRFKNEDAQCKIGDVLWYWYQVGENGQPQVGSFIATGVLLQKDGWYVMGGYSYDFDKIGTSVFLTAEQAAQAAMEGNGNDQT